MRIYFAYVCNAWPYFTKRRTRVYTCPHVHTVRARTHAQAYIYKHTYVYIKKNTPNRSSNVVKPTI
jgi:hypothetical protein